jgi:carbon-monoxide dehydrogenase iron sulfur subunit
MSRKITVTIEKCVGCHTCELACAIEHSQAKDIERMVLAGERPGYRIHVETYGPRSIPISCQHCEEAACVLACPTGAVSRRAPGKPVLVDEERCIGCSMCVQACPFGVMAMSPTGKSAFKCDLCVSRLAQGLQPACVSSCPTRALHLEEEGAANREKRKLAVARLAEAQAAGEQEQLVGG